LSLVGFRRTIERASKPKRPLHAGEEKSWGKKEAISGKKRKDKAIWVNARKKRL